MKLESNIFVISPEETISGEIDLVNELFANGMEVFHLRKPNALVEEVRSYVLGIDPMYRSKISLHSHHDLIDELGLCRIHYKEGNRRDFERKSGYVYSTSFHSVDAALEDGESYDYYFLSPIFTSISKEGHVGKGFKSPSKKAVALGGIKEGNLREVMDLGYEGVGVLGALWNNATKTVEVFNKMKKYYG